MQWRQNTRRTWKTLWIDWSFYQDPSTKLCPRTNTPTLEWKQWNEYRFTLYLLCCSSRCSSPKNSRDKVMYPLFPVTRWIYIYSFGSLTTKQPADNEQSGNMRLVELDGRRSRPIDHGPCTNVLNVCLSLMWTAELLTYRGQDTIRIIRKHYLSHAQSIYFSLMALGPAPIDSPFI